MKKRLAFIAAAAVFLGTAAPASMAAAGPGNCDCVWMATGYNMTTGEFEYEWVCPDPATCQITVPE